MTSRVVGSARALQGARFVLTVAAVGVLGVVGLSRGAYAQPTPHQVEHPYKPMDLAEMTLRARLAATPELDVEPVQGNIFTIFGAGNNIVVSVGADSGILVVDTGKVDMADKVLAVIKKLGTNVDPTRDAPPVPIRGIMNTNVRPESTGGNEKFGAVAEFVRGGEHIMAFENVLHWSVSARATSPG